MQLLALFVLRTTLRQCENLTDNILASKLGMTKDEVENLVKKLHDEHVIRFKYSFICPVCNETDTVEEDEIEKKDSCNLCGGFIDVKKLIEGATIRYILDKDAFCEYMEENFKEELMASRRGETPKMKVVEFPQSVDKDLKESVNMEQGENKLFISHSTKDVDYVRVFVEFLEAIGMPEGSIFCSSVEGYKIQWGGDIYEYLANEFNDPDKNLIVLFMLSDNYYDSTPCLNEMGATWILKKEYRSILLPGFEYKKIEGAINPNMIGIKFDGDQLKYDLNDIKKQMTKWFSLNSLDESRWDRVRDRLISNIEKIKSAI